MPEVEMTENYEKKNTFPWWFEKQKKIFGAMVKEEAEDEKDGNDSLSIEYKYLPQVREPANKQHNYY